jgi:hypothetical protein
MTIRLRRISPVQAGVVAGVLYGVLGIVVALFYSVVFAATRGASSSLPSAAGVLVIFFPFIYAALGFIGGALTAWLYNVVAGWVGGLELQFDPIPKELAG